MASTIQSCKSRRRILGALIDAADQITRIQGSDNDVRIFQLVQECQFNRSPAQPSSLSIGVTSEDLVSPPSAAVKHQEQNLADPTVNGRGDGQSPSTLLPPTSLGDTLNHHCSAQEQCYSRATIKDTQSSGLSPVDTVRSGPGPRGATATHNRVLHYSEVCTVVDSQSGCGTGAEGVVPSGEDAALAALAGIQSEPQQSSLRVSHHASPAAGHVTEQRTQAAPQPVAEQAAIVPRAPDGGASEAAGPSAVGHGTGHAACTHAAKKEEGEREAPVEVADAQEGGEDAQEGAEQCTGQIGAAGTAGAHQSKGPQDVGQAPTRRAQHSPNEEDAADAADGQLEDELEGFLPTQIDGLEGLMSPVHAESTMAAPEEPTLGAPCVQQNCAYCIGDIYKACVMASSNFYRVQRA